MQDIDKTLQELKDTQDFVQGRLVDKVAFTKFTQSLVGVWHKLRNTFDQKLQEITQRMAQQDANVVHALRSVRNDMDAVSSSTIASQKDLRKFVERELQVLRDQIQDVALSIPDDFNPESIINEIDRVKTSIPKVVTLQEVWDRFDALDKKIRAIEDTKPSIIKQVFGGGRPVHVPMIDDWSALTDGSTKEFYLSKAPRSLNTIKIWGSDFPYILRANVDFTITGKLVTLTSEVDTPSQGATLICEYYI